VLLHLQARIASSFRFVDEMAAYALTGTGATAWERGRTAFAVAAVIKGGPERRGAVGRAGAAAKLRQLAANASAVTGYGLRALVSFVKGVRTYHPVLCDSGG
jgi:hypothetical protein